MTDDPARRGEAQDTAHEAERAFLGWQQEYGTSPLAQARRYVQKDAFIDGYRRGRAEGDEAHKEARAMVVELVGREQALRAENARLREREYENSSLGTAEMDDLRAKLAAAEQREKRLREALQGALQCMEYTLQNHYQQITGTLVMAEQIEAAKATLAEDK